MSPDQGQKMLTRIRSPHMICHGKWEPRLAAKTGVLNSCVTGSVHVHRAIRSQRDEWRRAFRQIGSVPYRQTQTRCRHTVLVVAA